MGQGYSLTTLSAGSAGIDVPELSDLTYEKNLGEARFMKAVRARHNNGVVVAKVVMKPYASMKFAKYIEKIQRERKILFNIPNALGYHRALETSSNGYLLRQYIHSSIYDRLSTRPFLEDIEKRWLSFQLLTAVRDCHSRNVYHGDIKTENCLVTSWNWLYLSDFSSAYKPTYLPEDNPAEFSFYFDTSGRRTCYLAPERFQGSGETSEYAEELTWAMDIFSVGCVIAEIFLETPIFNLSQLFKYRSHEYDPITAYLYRIEDEDIRELVMHMIQLEPESRYSADEYLNFWRRKAFPEYFESFLHQYIYLITDPTSGRSVPSMQKTENNGESDDRIDRLYNDFDKIAYFLDYDQAAKDPSKPAATKSDGDMFPLWLNVPDRRQLAAPRKITKDDGTLLFLTIITSALRSTARAATRVRACELLLVFSQRITDEAKLDRVLPYLMVLVQDPSDMVKVAVLRSLAQSLAMVSITSPINAYLFPEYILPRLEAFSPPTSRKLAPLVRATYASCLALLAESASRFLDIIQVLRAEGAITSTDGSLVTSAVPYEYQDMYDVARLDLIKFFERQTKALLTDPHSDVRRAFLGSVSSLCVFFGSARANDVILSHLNTYLNDRDWRLKCSFFETIVGVAVYVGSTNLEEFILPLMAQALIDPEDSVVEKVLRSLSTMAKLGLLQRSRTWELVDLVARFMVHPNAWINEAAINFLSASTTYLTAADCECIMQPLIQPYLKIAPCSFAETDLLDALKKPLPRQVLDMASLWATKVETSTFWKPAQSRSFAILTDDRLLVESSVKAPVVALAKAYKTEEDQQWFARLRNCGMTAEDEVKLVALREYIWRSAQQKSRDSAESAPTRFNRVLNVSSLDIGIETVFFDQRDRYIDDAIPDRSPTGGSNTAQNIADALLDASTTVESPSWPKSNLGAYQSRARAELQHPSKPISIGKHSTRVNSPLAASPSAASGVVAESVASTAASEPKTSSKSNPRSYEASRSSTPSSIDTQRALQQEGLLQRKGSAIDLMQRKSSSSKAEAAISTSSANALGKNDGTYVARESASITPFRAIQKQQQNNPSQRQFRGAHNYDGRDPNVLKVLETVYLDVFPMDNTEFGPLVVPLQKQTTGGDQIRSADSQWKPNGALVAVFAEHTAAINRVLPSPDHKFFLTASDDGTARLWDCARLEQNLTHRSKQTYRHGTDVKITAACFIEDTHCFVTAGNDGTVHIVKVELTDIEKGNTRYSKPRVLRRWSLPDPQAHVVWLEHFRADAQSVLLMATTDGKVRALDLRSMDILYTLDNPVRHGTPTCFCVDNNKLWLLLGTSHGTLDLWDLRFHVRLKGWSMSGTSPIHRIFLHPAPPEGFAEGREQGPKKRQKLVCAVGGTDEGEVTVWDLETAACAGVFRTTTPTATDPAPSRSKKADTSTRYNLTNLDTQQTPSMLSQVSNSLPQKPQSRNEHNSRSMRALAVGSLSTSTSGTPKEPYFVTAGPDQNVRFWNLEHIERSCIVSSPLAADLGARGTESRTRFRRADKTGLLPVFEESINDTSKNASSEHDGSARSSDTSRSRANVGSKRSTTGSGTGLSQNGDDTPQAQSTATLAPKTKSTLISEQQQRLLRSHLDTVLDVAVLDWPKRMVVSVDRSGVVFVFS